MTTFLHQSRVHVTGYHAVFSTPGAFDQDQAIWFVAKKNFRTDMSLTIA